jgi:RNA polymerase sigma-70 factor (ECF subfamily)
LARVHDLFSADERQVADLRAQGLAWAEVAERLGGTAQARRMQLARAADRVARQLGLDDAESSES